jgi:hypothetical protein
MIRFLLLISCLLLFAPLNLQAANDDPPLTLLPQKGQSQTPQNSQPASHITSELHDIYGPVPISEPPPYLLIVGIVAAFLILLAVLYYYFKLRKKPSLPPIPPWEKALQELSAARSFLHPQESLIYLEKASMILRDYIESRFGIISTKQTTREFLTGLEFATDSSLLQTHKKELRNCLQKADMAKFAHHSVEQSELGAIEQSIVSFIEKTTPQDHVKGADS